MRAKAAPAQPVHICPGECEDENCPCCLGECSCLGDPYGPTKKPLKPTDAMPHTAASLAVKRERAACGEALDHAGDLAVLLHQAALRLRGGHVTAHDRAGEDKGRKRKGVDGGS